MLFLFFFCCFELIRPYSRSPQKRHGSYQASSHCSKVLKDKCDAFVGVDCNWRDDVEFAPAPASAPPTLFGKWNDVGATLGGTSASRAALQYVVQSKARASGVQGEHFTKRHAPSTRGQEQ